MADPFTPKMKRALMLLAEGHPQPIAAGLPTMQRLVKYGLASWGERCLDAHFDPFRKLEITEQGWRRVEQIRGK